MNPFEENDRELVQAARTIIAERYKEFWHGVGAALRTKSGRVFSAVHLEARCGRISVCAEAVAIGMAASAGDTEIETIVAVSHTGEIVPPCGMCRELIQDYSPEARVIVEPTAGRPEIVSVAELLPVKYWRT